jgi:hypothetical protein
MLILLIVLSPILLPLFLLYTLLALVFGLLMCCWCFMCCCGATVPPQWSGKPEGEATRRDAVRAVGLCLFMPCFMVFPMAGLDCCKCLVGKEVRRNIGWD